MTRCPQCSEEFASLDPSCPGCGTDFASQPIAVRLAERADRKRKERPDRSVSDLPEEAAAHVAPSWGQAVFRSLLDPRSIQWILMVGGGLLVLGLVIWLGSLAFFRQPLVLAWVMAIGTAAVLGTGWFVAGRTRFRVAGQALTFLACVVAPLNLWFHHAQGLATLDQLWIGSLVCCLAYAATARILRDPLFVYTLAGGVTMTGLLILATLGRLTDGTSLPALLIVFGLAFLHAERAFAPGEGPFSRRRFGLPFFWCAQAHIAIGLCLLLGVQALNWLGDATQGALGFRFAGLELADARVLAGALWVTGAYAYLYADIVVRRVGIYTYAAAFCLLWAIVTLAGWHLHAEGLIVVLALVAVAANAGHRALAKESDRLGRVIAPLGIVLSSLPLVIGVVWHARASSAWMPEGWTVTTGWFFVVAMCVVAVTSRASAFLQDRSAPQRATTYIFLSAAALIVAAAGLLRSSGLTEWHHQAPLLMLIPIAYMLASRGWRGRSSEHPVAWVAHTASALILAHVLVNTLAASGWSVFGQMPLPTASADMNLPLAAVFVAATVFYALAAVVRRRGVNIYLATGAACGALWQLLGHWETPGVAYTAVYALLGLGLLIGARFSVRIGESRQDLRSARQRLLQLPTFQSGNAVLSVAFLAASLQGAARLVSDGSEWQSIAALALTAGASLLALWLAPPSGWRRWYATTAIASGALGFLSLNVLLDLGRWQKLEIFCVVAGLVCLLASHVTLWRERGWRTRPDDQAPPAIVSDASELATFGLWLGSLLVVAPILIAVVVARTSTGLSLPNELALLTLAALLLVCGLVSKVKATTVGGGGALCVHAAVLIVSVGYTAQLAVGVYLAIGGGLLFGLGLLLSLYRERLMRLPERIAAREGLFRVLDWR